MKRLIGEIQSRRGIATVMFVLIGLAAPYAFAQEGETPEETTTGETESEPSAAQTPIEFNEEQRRLNNKATNALGETPPDTDTAVRNIEAALAAGDAGNVLYLSLGRAHQKAGRCELAESAFTKARKAPPVAGVPNDAVTSRLDRYVGELSECFGTLRIACQSPEDTRLRVSGRDVNCDEAVRLDPAKHIVTARRKMQRVDIPVDVEGGKEARVSVDLTSEGPEPPASVWEAATGRVRLALGSAEDIAVRRAEEQQRRQRDDAEVNAQIKSERVALAAERVIANGKQPTGGGAGVAANTSTGVMMPAAEVPPESAGDLTLQLALLAPVGGFGLKGDDGFDDAGIAYGVTGDLVGRYAGAKKLAADVHVQFDYTLGQGFGVKQVDGTDGQTIDQQHWRFLAETRGWLAFLGIGFFANHRSQKMFYEQDEEFQTKYWSAGPSLTFATSGIDRTDAYFDITLRWAPLFEGDLNHLMAGFEVATGYLMVSLFYEIFTGDSFNDDSAIAAGETVFLRLGARVPYKTNLLPDVPTTAELEMDR